MATTTKAENTTSAVIETGGKQYRVNPGQGISIEKLDGEVGSKITFDRVLLVVDGKESHVGAPHLTSHSVTGEVVEQGKGKKVRVFTFKSKKRQKRTLGHRQLFTKVKILTVGASKPTTKKSA